jgi:cation diffusion facilitator CzcD-associated flavoprotein CzcO
MTKAKSTDAPDHDAAAQIAREWLDAFGAAIALSEPGAVRALLTDDAYWRDILALSWDIRTFSGVESTSAGLTAYAEIRKPVSLTLDEASVQSFKRRTIGPSIEAFFDFETDIGLCRGHFRLRNVGAGSDKWAGWTVFTALENLKGHEEKAGNHRPADNAHDLSGRWINAADHAAHFETNEPDTVIIGGAQTGLALAARLGALDVPTLVIDKETRIGDVWRNRYQSLVLHNPIWANHFPYIPFPATWPVYITKDQLAEWLEIYRNAMSIATWTSTALEESHYDTAEKRWTLRLRRGDGSISVVHPRNVVMATGVFGGARRIDVPGANHYSGQLLYAAEYAGGLDIEGKRVLVVGSGSSAHDISQELNSVGASVTMLQRGSTCVISVEPGAALPYALYCENGLPVEQADMLSNTIPYPLLLEFHKEMTKRVIEMDKDLIAGLNRVGFATNNGEEDSGFLTNFFHRGGGYYINVGASDLIVSGEIKVKHGTTIAGFDGKTVNFADGSEAQYDLVIIAAGYDNMQESVRAIMGEEVAEKVGPIWGIDEQSELRAMWKRTGQEGFWIAGGGLQQNRSFSKYLALQIKARQLGFAP